MGSVRTYQEECDWINAEIAAADIAPGFSFVSYALVGANVGDQLQPVYVDQRGRLWSVMRDGMGNLKYTLLMDAPINGATFSMVVGDEEFFTEVGPMVETDPEWKRYVRSGITEMRPWVESMGMDGISISAVDRVAGSPKPGDMIARKMSNHADQWLVSAEFFAEAQFKEV